MLHEIGRELEARLRAKGCPFKVVDREEFKRTSWTSGVVVLEETGDTYSGSTSQSRNPKRYYDGKIGAKLSVYAKSARAGALEFEHRRLARQAIDLALVGLRYIRGVRRQHIAIGAGAWVPIEDLAGSDRPGGVKYELALTVDRAVEDRNWAGEAFEEATLASYAMTGEPTLTFATVDSSVTRSAGSWIDDGFAVGMTVRIAGSASNDVTGEIETVDALAITLAATAITDEGPVSGCTVEAGGITHTTLVSTVADDSTPELACGA